MSFFKAGLSDPVLHTSGVSLGLLPSSFAVPSPGGKQKYFIFKNHAKNLQLSLNIRAIKCYRLFENRKYLPLVTCFNSKPFFLRLHKFFVHGYLHVQSIFVLQKILVFVLLFGNILQQFLYLILFIRYLGVKYTV